MLYKCSVIVNFRSFVTDHLLHLKKFNVMFSAPEKSVTIYFGQS